jgi:Tfp pilus assembly protein PilX
VVSNNNANVLVGLVVTMLIFAVLAAGMVSLTSTSTSNQVTANSTDRAYYLAESGFRYAASEYLNTGDLDGDDALEDDRNMILEGIHNVEFNLSEPNEKFRLRLYPYFYTTTITHNAGTTNLLVTKFTGAQPADLTVPASGRLEIGSTIYDYTAYNSGTGTFTLTAVISETINDNMIVKPVANPSGIATMTQNGDLTLLNASTFPMLNGKFKVSGIKYAYVSRDTNTLQNITDAEDPSRAFSVSVDSSTDVILEPFLKVISLGTVGQHDLKATRQITYNVPLPADPTKGERVEFYDPFDDTSHWNASTLGSHGVVDIGGENVLKVTGGASGMGSTDAGLISINWSSTNVNFASAHRLAGNYLSYDTQTKIGFDSVPVPANYGFDAQGIPTYYAAGISFRWDVDDNFYGLSFMRGRVGAVPDDGIDDSLVPEDDINLIVLWQQTGNGTTRKWLAYNEVGLIFKDDMEIFNPNWDATNFITNQWQRVQNASEAHSGEYFWHDSQSGNYAPDENSSLISPSVDLSDASGALLIFWHKYEFESIDIGDHSHVEISRDGTTWDELALFTNIETSWKQELIPIPSSYTGIAENNTNVRVRFRLFADSDAEVNDGWWVDDVKIVRDFDINKATLLLRLVEGATLQFDSGGTTAIEKGDIVSQANGARGIVINPPILQAGSWAGGDASGILILNNVSSTAFQTGNPLNVPGKGNNLATAQGFKARDNYIQAYYGNKDGDGTPDGNPYDQQRQPNDIGLANWPPDPGDSLAAETDYYTLVQWNYDVDASVSRLQDEDGKFTIIATDTLTSPTGIFPYSRPELGLHAMGDGVTNVFYEDFAIQLDVQSGSGLLTPIQQ